MIVIADTSPLNYLIQIGHISVLPTLYNSVWIPHSVLFELQDEGSLPTVKSWALQPPDWLEIRSALPTQDAELESLDPGEREAIQLMEQSCGDLLLIDERRGSSIAKRRGLKTTGLLGILIDAHDAQLLDGELAFQLLAETTNFHYSEQLRVTYLKLLKG